MEDMPTSATAECFITAIGTGTSHVNAVANMARALAADGVTVEAVKCFASLGASGSCSSNTERDMHTWLSQLYDTRLEPYFLHMTLPSRSSLAPIPVILPVLPIHEMFHTLFLNGAQFEVSMLGAGGHGSVSTFWQNLSQEEWDTPHHVLELSDRAAFVPVNHHNDGAAVNNYTEMQSWTWSSQLVKGDSWDTKFLYAWLPYEYMSTPEWKKIVHRELCNFVQWCHEAGESGRFPLTGYYGEQFPDKSYRSQMRGQLLAGGWKFAFFAWKGDRKARKETHQFETGTGSAFVCDVCLACQGFKKGVPRLFYGNCNPSAPWLQTFVPHDLYLRRTPILWQSPWRVVKGWTIHRNAMDIMHDLYLGCGFDICGAILHELSTELPGAGRNDNLKKLFLDCRAWCRANGVYAPPQEWSVAFIHTTHSNHYPCLDGIKAAHCKVIIFFLAHTLCEIANRKVIISSETYLVKSWAWSI